MTDITIERARELAAESAIHYLGKYRRYPGQPLHSDQHIETDEFFVFPHNKEVNYPVYAGLICNRAFAVLRRIYSQNSLRRGDGKYPVFGIPAPTDPDVIAQPDKFADYLDNIEKHIGMECCRLLALALLRLGKEIACQLSV